jgi:site-specific recombinase XerC
LTHLAEAIPGDSMMGLRDRAIVALMAVHGLRRVEVERLNDSSLRIEGEAGSLEVHGKGQKVRHIFLRPDTLAILRAYLDAKKLAGFPPGGPFSFHFPIAHAVSASAAAV